MAVIFAAEAAAEETAADDPSRCSLALLFFYE
jgi:hypothetical protein